MKVHPSPGDNDVSRVQANSEMPVPGKQMCPVSRQEASAWRTLGAGHFTLYFADGKMS